MTQPTFNIFDRLSEWSETLPLWQRFLLGKLVAEVELPKAVLDDVFSEYLIDQELAAPEAVRIDWSMVLPEFQQGDSAAASVLSEMSDVNGVNALVSDQTLSFGPQLTVVYGPNGAGKSGYVRVLKSACFTRSKEVGILGDVKITKNQQPKPTAKFSFKDGSAVQFVHGEPCKPMHDGFAVFDSACVRVHLDGRNAFQVKPYLFDVFPRMVDVVSTLQTKLSDEIKRRTPVANKYAIENSSSEVATMLSALTAQTDVMRLRELAVCGEAESDRLRAIAKQLVELRTKDPREIVKKNEQCIADLKAVHTAIGALPQAINPARVEDLANAALQIAALVEQGAALSAARFGGEPVQPVGTRAWRDLLTAAIAYGEEAYPGAPFPPDTDGARCVLCQQTLDSASLNRLYEFYQTATSDVETQLAAARCTLKLHGVTLAKIGLSFFGEESAARRTTQKLDATLAAAIVRHLEGFQKVVDFLRDAVVTETPPVLSLLMYDAVSDKLVALTDRLDQDNQELRQSNPQVLIDALLLEQQLLTDRQLLAGQYSGVAEAVEDLNWVAKAKKCHNSLPKLHREITSKQKDLTTELIAQDFIARFNENCKTIGLKHEIQFRIAGKAGTTDRQIELTNAVSTGVDPSQVLSEGEQTAAALADFLTEVGINGTCVGVIFDDPVTSMDHVYKEAIAQRLVSEAERRQVVVFTHDILFTNYLATAATEKRVAFAGRTVWLDDANSPGAIDRLAFPHGSYDGAAFGKAEKYSEQAETLVGDPQRDALEKACGSLRTAYEDFIQKKLFNSVVQRWREKITYTLDQVYFDEQIAMRIHERMNELSRYIDAHSHSEEFHAVPLTINLVKGELEKFKSIKADYKKARSDWETAKSPTKCVFS